MAMSRWIRRVLGVLALGGGAVGLIVVLTTVLQTSNVIAVLFMLGFCAIYVFGIACGIALIEGHSGALHASAVYWALQVPALNTRVFGYFLSSGFHLTIYYRWDQARFGIDFLVGSIYRFNLLHVINSPMAGVNVFALAVFVYLVRCRGAVPVDFSLARTVEDRN